MARGKQETQFSAAEPPDWKQLRSRCLELFGRSKDLRIAMTLAVASMELDGLPGFRESLSLVKGLLETYWPTFYPQLDPADDNDPLQRMNIVASLATPIGTFGDPFRILERLRAMPLCNSVQMGRYSLADILRAETGVPSADDKPDVKMPPDRRGISRLKARRAWARSIGFLAIASRWCKVLMNRLRAPWEPRKRQT